ncbi:LysM peptidoglycan-binding domain-containing protein [Desulfobacterota bacterium AH_259_B03_O07]|nr:LysM peptidoglycan-binding domain-containing protein [Desulfobacterota bacterium AH_259_B03_O07]
MSITTFILLILLISFSTPVFSKTQYIVKNGDNLYDISKQFKVTIKDLKNANGLKSNRLDIGDILLIPVSDKELNEVNTHSFNSKEYTVVKGDTLGGIGNKFGVSTTNLKRSNNLKNDKLQIGQKLSIPSTLESHEKSSSFATKTDLDFIGPTLPEETVQDDKIQQPSETHKIKTNNAANVLNTNNEKLPTNNRYIVKKGDNLYDISRKFNISVNNLKKANGLKNHRLDIGDKLLIPGSNGQVNKVPTNKVNNHEYAVVRGDTLGGIGSKFGVTVKRLKSANNLKNNYIKIGQLLIIPIMPQTDAKNNIVTGNVEKDTIAPKKQEDWVPETKVTLHSNSKKYNSNSKEFQKTTAEKLPTNNRYIVKNGDNLYDISRKFNISVNNLKKANGLKNHRLDIGDKLLIPGSNGQVNKVPTNKVNNHEYAVVRGDTLGGIGSKFGVTVKRLKRANNLKNNNIKIGQLLIIPYLSKIDDKVKQSDKKELIAKNTRENEKQLSTSKDSDTQTFIRYLIKNGDTLGKISREFGLSIQDLKKVNGLKNDRLQIGVILNIPSTGTKGIIKRIPEEKPSLKYIVKEGDNIEQLSKGFEISAQSIIEANDLTNNTINPGDILSIPDPKYTGVSFNQTEHKVVKGESLIKISSKYGVSVKELKKVNRLRTNNIKIGMKLKIPSNNSIAKNNSIGVPSHLTDLKYYKVNKGDTLGLIAIKHNTSVEDLKKSNGLIRDSVRAGQILIIPEHSNHFEDLTTERNYYYEQNGKASSESTSFKDRVIKIAKQFLGVPYRFGGNSLRTGLDCSAYVKEVYGILDIYLPRTARDIYKVGRYVKKNQLSIGDLVFFRTYARYPSHVGIYIGNDKFIHASSKSRKVTIDNINLNYYSKRYIGAKRIETAGLFYDEISKDYKGFELN